MTGWAGRGGRAIGSRARQRLRSARRAAVYGLEIAALTSWLSYAEPRLSGWPRLVGTCGIAALVAISVTTAASPWLRRTLIAMTLAVYAAWVADAVVGSSRGLVQMLVEGVLVFIVTESGASVALPIALWLLVGAVLYEGGRLYGPGGHPRMMWLLQLTAICIAACVRLIRTGPGRPA